MKLTLLMALLATGAALAACSKPVPCPVCYEDEWSREPFPGQAKQHIKPLEPKDLEKTGGMVPTEFLGTVSPSTPERW